MKKRIFWWLLAILVAGSYTSWANNEMYLGLTISFHSFSNIETISPWTKLNINQRDASPLHSFHWQENHHLYWGAAILGFGYYFKSKPLKIVGAVVIFDDLVQHSFHVQTPLYLINNKLWRYQAFRRLSQTFDRLFK
ncbi:MAG: hypothetical protein COV55_02485 [Candidatus Komeilibacteria bacterium CG11_big_fil_rev_8_21_14_0_20_36_20]|uniref:Uncharacterized protein n=1 Tax=Candidatus Komeilibacteria bacterium CG11_big_fil_rev_8_21_14_0_20_36_20 TaxID=1974477 RepID=A0A2H0NF68_9BACT|nr:MAG: hypothetical protein COV55_02485 [Candidatus Komeilibacteria bacterium CG11_big_fil_rev_8_21_14_0_20_36_20]PIR81841.1 MAG: hypothetical protein COU21_01545 [Candidatus Komeilibacteria bacterium CG10_big_fil_rev_8_21_14_0_10_36_65]PJC55332.1 MAG: hypothetical protein CO027_02885 [Candidatus Komeilibacteria bacterium CG_4_9_14_0_2_um_filter_36_13]